MSSHQTVGSSGKKNSSVVAVTTYLRMVSLSLKAENIHIIIPVAVNDKLGVLLQLNNQVFLPFLPPACEVRGKVLFSQVCVC